jgi:hypothetical protein
LIAVTPPSHPVEGAINRGGRGQPGPYEKKKLPTTTFEAPYRNRKRQIQCCMAFLYNRRDQRSERYLMAGAFRVPEPKGTG